MPAMERNHDANGPRIRAENRKSSKPAMERRRRQRINQSLSELKSLLLDSMRRSDKTRQNSKLEKADILELTVRHLQTLHHQQRNNPPTVAATNVDQYRAGFGACITTTWKFLSQQRRDGRVSDMLLNQLVRHLEECVTTPQQGGPTSVTPSVSSVTPSVSSVIPSVSSVSPSVSSVSPSVSSVSPSVSSVSPSVSAVSPSVSAVSPSVSAVFWQLQQQSEDVALRRLYHGSPPCPSPSPCPSPPTRVPQTVPLSEYQTTPIAKSHFSVGNSFVGFFPLTGKQPHYQFTDPGMMVKREDTPSPLDFSAHFAGKLLRQSSVSPCASSRSSSCSDSSENVWRPW
ncbi:hypothetical protein BV898_03697 [Hypsibius exemplaris]|uniref:BHLH domain-containing protein n=1 Tax=Hypsibius exemplaris TaxID=2072580 RepID=A0A1W0X4Y5_HYPEX|nr:hypothetical protein BV898_03697 [Hypsibius exemplaris]